MIDGRCPTPGGVLIQSKARGVAAKRQDHPLALLFWSQFFLIYALPVGLEITDRWRGASVAPGHMARAVYAIYPYVMLAAATVTVMADFAAIYTYVIRRTCRLPAAALGISYAVAAVVAWALVVSGTRNAAIAWADYVAQGSTTGIIVRLLALVLEIFAATALACQMLALARRWRRLGRLAPPPIVQRN